MLLQKAMETKKTNKNRYKLKKTSKVAPYDDYKLIARESIEKFKKNLKTTTFKIREVEVGNQSLLIIAGPCAVHNEEQTLEIARRVKQAGAHMLRGGAFKPRTSPYDFQGLGKDGLEILIKAREETGLPIVTEVTDPRLVEIVGKSADVFQIGSRNMQNYALLQEVGKYAGEYDKGVLLKTGLMPKLKEVLCAAEYLAYEGAEKIILCERGINVPANGMRNTPRPEFLIELRKATYLPVIADPSHSAGDRELVIGIANQYLQAAANGLIIEVIRDQEKSEINGTKVCDYNQGVRISDFENYLKSIKNFKVEQKWI